MTRESNVTYGIHNVRVCSALGNVEYSKIILSTIQLGSSEYRWEYHDVRGEGHTRKLLIIFH